MAKKTTRSRKPRAKSRSRISGKLVPLNPWIPAVPLKGAKGMFQLILGLPFVLAAVPAAGEPLSARLLQVPVELTRQGLSLRELNQQVLARQQALLNKYEARLILVQK